MHLLHPLHGFLVEWLLVAKDFDGCVHSVGVPTALNDGSKFSRCSEQSTKESPIGGLFRASTFVLTECYRPYFRTALTITISAQAPIIATTKL